MKKGKKSNFIDMIGLILIIKYTYLKKIFRLQKIIVLMFFFLNNLLIKLTEIYSYIVIINKIIDLEEQISNLLLAST